MYDYFIELQTWRWISKKTQKRKNSLIKKEETAYRSSAIIWFSLYRFHIFHCMWDIGAHVAFLRVCVSDTIY